MVNRHLRLGIRCIIDDNTHASANIVSTTHICNLTFFPHTQIQVMAISESMSNRSPVHLGTSLWKRSPNNGSKVGPDLPFAKFFRCQRYTDPLDPPTHTCQKQINKFFALSTLTLNHTNSSSRSQAV